MSNLSVWDIGRQAKLAGTTTVQTFNPADLTVRIRNSAAKMVRRGVKEGYGQAAMVADMLMKRYGVDPVRTWGNHDYGGVFFPNNFNAIRLEAYDELTTLCRAGFSAWLLEGNHAEHTVDWRREDHKNHIEALRAKRGGGVATSSHNVYFYGMQKQALQCIEANRTDEYKTKLEEIVEYLYTNEPIHVTTFQY
jgi:hypothetical protein